VDACVKTGCDDEDDDDGDDDDDDSPEGLSLVTADLVARLLLDINSSSSSSSTLCDSFSKLSDHSLDVLAVVSCKLS
jgi:hypothetical protein